MSPSSREINGPRPSPLKIHKDSHQIQKQSSSTSSTTTTTSSTAGGAHQKQRHQPIIIYTHSPKVIHTQAQDFMALVQKLTGLSRSPADADATGDKKLEPKPTNKALDRAHGTPPPPPPPPSTAVDPTAELGFDLPQPTSSFLSEMPLFTPSSADHFFCSPKSLYRFAEAKSFPEF